MKSTTFGSVVAASVAGLLMGGIALANEAKKVPAAPKADAKAAATGEHWCKSNGCGGKVAGAKNDCAGKPACQGVTEAACMKDGHGTWTSGAKPATK